MPQWNAFEVTPILWSSDQLQRWVTKNVTDSHASARLRHDQGCPREAEKLQNECSATALRDGSLEGTVYEEWCGRG